MKHRAREGNMPMRRGPIESRDPHVQRMRMTHAIRDHLSVFDVVHRSTAGALASAFIHLGSHSAPTMAGLWLLRDSELPPMPDAFGLRRTLRDVWDSGAPVPGDPPRPPLLGAEPASPARPQVTAPGSEGCG
ncbi:hypothetical protein [Embleya sp. NPDC020630]|uniref:hypothetical protein n=1 Tax=Embleya sp. NPDC020630 TaxID=3363979 RepID=UPI0037AFF712